MWHSSSLKYGIFLPVFKYLFYVFFIYLYFPHVYIFTFPGCLVLSAGESQWGVSCQPSRLGLHYSNMACRCALRPQLSHVVGKTFHCAAVRWPCQQNSSAVWNHRLRIICEDNSKATQIDYKTNFTMMPTYKITQPKLNIFVLCYIESTLNSNVALTSDTICFALMSF